MSGIKLTSDTLIGTPAGGNIEYNGQFYGTDSNNSRAQIGRLVLETAKSATGTSVDFTGIPSWVKRITVMFSGVSTNGTSLIQIQLGDSGGVENTGYTGRVCDIATGANNGTSGIILSSDNATANVYNGQIYIININANQWVSSSNLVRSDAQNAYFSAYNKTLSATLDRIRITTVNGTDTLDAGTINILYEG